MEDIKYLFYATFIQDKRYKLFLEGLGNTILLTISCFILGTFFGALLCILKRSKNKTVSKITYIVTSFLTEVPTLVMLMIFAYVIFGAVAFPLLWSVVIALTVKQGAYISDIFVTVIESIDHGEIEAAMTLGMSNAQCFKHVILPQIVLKGTGLYKNQFIITMQETSVVGYLAIVDLTRASSIIASRTMDAMFSLIVVTILYFVIGRIAKRLIDIPSRKKHIGGEAE